MALKAWGVCLRLLFLLVRDVHITLAFLTVVLCFATWKFLKVAVWPASESSSIKLVNYVNYLGTGTVSDCWRSSPSFGQSLEGCAALLRLSWHLGDWQGVGEPWLLAGDEVWGNLGRGTRKLHGYGWTLCQSYPKKCTVQSSDWLLYITVVFLGQIWWSHLGRSIFNRKISWPSRIS